MPGNRKIPKRRVEFYAATAEVDDWQSEAKKLKVSLSAFIRRACERYSNARKKKREDADKGDDAPAA